MKKLNTKGFGLIGTLLVVLAIAAVAGGSVCAYHRSNRAKTVVTTTGTMTKSGSGGNSSANHHVVRLPELGVQITLPDSLKDFKYVASNVDYSDPGNNTLGTYPTAYLGTKQLEDLGCAATGEVGNAPALGFLTKTTGQYPAVPTAENTTGALVKQFSGFYVSYRASMTCSQVASTNQVQTTDVQLLKNALPSLQPIQ